MKFHTVNRPTEVLSLTINKSGMLPKRTRQKRALKLDRIHDRTEGKTYTLPNDKPPATIYGPLHPGTHYSLAGTITDLVALLADRTYYPVRDNTRLSKTALYEFEFDVLKPGTAQLDENYRIRMMGEGPFWRQQIFKFDDGLQAIGLHLVPLASPQTMPNIVIDNLASSPTP